MLMLLSLAAPVAMSQVNTVTRNNTVTQFDNVTNNTITKPKNYTGLPPVLPQLFPLPANPNTRCPTGYDQKDPRTIAGLPYTVVCSASLKQATICQKGSYACGLDGTSCCAAGTPNTCFPGAYACSTDPRPNATRSACCIRK